jgi:putative membrane protein
VDAVALLHLIEDEPWVVALLVASALLYGTGVTRLWRKAGVGHGIERAAVGRFVAGWMFLAAALVSPIDAWAERFFWMHMVQHEALMLLAAPLLVLGRPLEAWAWALPKRWPIAIAACFRRGAIASAWQAINDPLGAWLLHAAALWLWHLPRLFEAALANEAVHALQHATFFGTALLFWRSVHVATSRGTDGAALASLFTTMAHTGALGALLTVARAPLYPSYAALHTGWLTALEDQQLGGVIMWVPASLAYLFAALAIVARLVRALPPPSRTGDSPARS